MMNAPFNYSESCTIQNEVGTAISCATAQYDGPVGQFANAATASYGLAAMPCESGRGGLGAVSRQISLPIQASTLPRQVSSWCPVVPWCRLGFQFPSSTLPLRRIRRSMRGQASAAFPINHQDAYLEQMNLHVQKEFGATS